MTAFAVPVVALAVASIGIGTFAQSSVRAELGLSNKMAKQPSADISLMYLQAQFNAHQRCWAPNGIHQLLEPPQSKDRRQFISSPIP